MAEYELSKFDAETVTYQEAERDIELIQAELVRREAEERTPAVGWDPAEEARKVTHFTQRILGDRFGLARERYNSYSPSSAAGRQASAEIDILYAEYRRRGLTIPVTPASQGPWRKRRPKTDAA